MPENIQGTIASIAILDDDADFRTYLEDFLTDESIYSVRAFGNARELFESCEESLPDIVLLDMPERGVIGIGEPVTIPTASAVANAVANALGVRVSSLPITPKRVLEALGKQVAPGLASGGAI